MTDKTHQIIGITAATAGFLAFYPNHHISWPILLTVTVASSLGSLAPDIDQPTAHLWDEIPLGRFVGKIVSRSLGGHRNLSHSLLGIALFVSLAYWLVRIIPSNWNINPDIATESFALGYIAHLIADAVTVMGIPLFWPLGNNMGFPPRPFDGIRIITGKWFENMIILPAALILLVLIVWSSSDRFCPLVPIACR